MTGITNVAVAIKINDRYYTQGSQKKRLKTAWSLAGARLFLNDERYFMPIITRLRAKYPQHQITLIILQEALR